MNAAVWYGGKNIRVEKVPQPIPGPGEALVKVNAVGICGSDLHAYRGVSKRRTPPLIMGHEFAGVVEEISKGSTPTELSVGDRVTMIPAVPCGRCEQCRSGRMNLCRTRTHAGLDFPGAFAEYVKAPLESFYHIPDSISFEEAALVEPVSVGIHAVDLAGVKEMQDVLILGCGVIGLSCLICARKKARRIIVSDLIDFRLSCAKSYGADTAVNSSNQDIVEEVRKVTENRGVDAALEAVGLEKTIEEAILSVKEGGRVTVIGMLDETIRVNILKIVLKEIQLEGSYGRTDNEFRKAISTLEADANELRRLITHRFPLRDVSRAFETLCDANQNAIKVVLIP